MTSFFMLECIRERQNLHTLVSGTEAYQGPQAQKFVQGSMGLARDANPATTMNQDGSGFPLAQHSWPAPPNLKYSGLAT